MWMLKALSASGLNKFLGEEIHQRIKDADAVLVCIPNQIYPKDRPLLAEQIEMLKVAKKPFGVVITKSDLEASEEDQKFMNELIPDSTPRVVVPGASLPESQT